MTRINRVSLSESESDILFIPKGETGCATVVPSRKKKKSHSRYKEDINGEEEWDTEVIKSQIHTAGMQRYGFFFQQFCEILMLAGWKKTS